MQVAQVNAGKLGAARILAPDLAVVQAAGARYATARMLCASWVDSALKRWQLQSYDQVRHLLEMQWSGLEVRDLWRNLFDEDAPAGLLGIDLDRELAGRIHRELFPLSLSTYDGYANTADWDLSILLQAGLIIESWGVAWEVLVIDDLPPAIQPLVACFCVKFAEDNYVYGRNPVEDTVAGRIWWERRGYPEPPRSLWCEGDEWNVIYIQGAIEYLDGLEPPLDGLGVALRCCVRGNGNAFLDMVELWWRGEYDEWDYWDWSQRSAELLTEQWEEAKPLVERLDAYYEWFDERPLEHEERALRILLGLDEELGLVEEAGIPLYQVLYRGEDDDDR